MKKCILGSKWTLLALSAALASMLLVGVSFAQSQTPPAVTPTVAPPTATSTPVPLTVTPIPSPTPMPGFWQRTAGDWVKFAGAITVAILGGAFGLWQLQKSHKAQRELDREKLAWEREKLQLEHKLELERISTKAERERQLREAEAEEVTRREVEAEAERARTAEECATAYRCRLISQLCNLKILDMPSPLSLETVYVQLRVREEEPPRYAEEEEMVPLAEGEPTELLRLSQARLAERVAIAMPPEEALVKFRRMAVVGDPGAGKTTMLRYLALRMAQEDWPNLPRLPVYVELRRFVDSGLGNLLDFAASDWAERYGFPDARPYIEQQLDAGGAALLLDGLDEVLGGASPDEAQEAYNRVAAEVNRLATRFSDAPIAVTCRWAGWRGGLTAYQTLEVLDFDWDQIQEFVENWFKSDPSKAEGLRRALAGNLRMQTLAANPLILSLIAIVYQRELELPERRAELYNRCVEVLLREWDAHRGIKRFSQFTTDRKRDLLEEVAWHFHRAGRRYFPEADLLRLVSSFLPTIDIPPEENKAILDEIAAQYGLLKVQAHGWYGFLHLTLQEYFAALAANERGVTGLQTVVAPRHDPWWEEVVLLLAGRMADATPLLLGILGRLPGESLPEHISELVPEGEALAVNDDLFHSDILLAARCLAGTPRVRMRGLRERIIADVRHILLTSPYSLDWNRAARALVEIGGEVLTDELLEMLADKRIEPPRRRASIAGAFGELGDRRVAQLLLALLERDTELDQYMCWNIVYALAALKATFAIPSLLVMLKERGHLTQERIAKALGTLGDKSIVPDLMEILADEEYHFFVRRSIVQTVGRLGDKSVAPLLLQMLLDETTDAAVKPFIARALRDLRDASLTSSMLEQLQRETIEWQIRWLLTESLEGLQESVNAPLMEMLKSLDVDKRIKVGIAATLGTWGERASIPYLCEAIESRVVPPNWQLNNFILVGHVWCRITRVLHSLGSNSVVPKLIEAFERSIAKRDEEVLTGRWCIHNETAGTTQWTMKVVRPLAYELQGIAYAASEYKPEEIARQVLSMFRGRAWVSHDLDEADLVGIMQALATKSLTPALLDLWSERSVYDVPWWRWIGIVTKIAQEADDIETARALLEMMSTVPDEEETELADVIHRALYEVSQRARVQVSPDGQIQSLVDSPNVISEGTAGGG